MGQFSRDKGAFFLPVVKGVRTPQQKTEFCWSRGSGGPCANCRMPNDPKRTVEIPPNTPKVSKREDFQNWDPKMI